MNENMALFAATLLHSSTNTHFFHWSTDSFSKHMALGTYYDEIVDLVDDLVEAQKEVETLQIDALWVLKRAALLADFNINKFIRVEGGEAVYDFSVATEDDWYCIQEYVVDSMFIKGEMGLVPVDKIRLKTYDKLRALELVGKHINVGAFKEKLELSGDEENPIQTITRRIIKVGDSES